MAKQKLVLRIILAFIVIAIALPPVIEFSLSSYREPDGSRTEKLEADYRAYIEGKREGSLPFEFYFPEDEVVLNFTMPEVNDGLVLSFLTRSMGVKVLIGDEEVYSFTYPEKVSYPQNRIYHVISLKSDYSGMPVTMLYYPKTFSLLGFTIDAPYIGTSSSNFNYFFSDYRYASVLLIVFIELSILIAIVSFFMKKKLRKILILFSVFVLCTTLSLFCGMLLSQVVLENPYLASLGEIFFRSVLPLLLILFLNANYEVLNLFSLDSGIALFAIAILALFPVFSILDALSLIPFTLISSFLDPLLILFLSIVLTMLFRRKDRRSRMYGVAILFLMLSSYLRFISSAYLYARLYVEIAYVLLTPVSFVVCIIEAVISYTEENEMIITEETLLKNSFFDGLSTLGSANAFSAFASTMDQRAGNYYVSYFDLDGLKRVNDSFGHIKGDEIISLFGTIVSSMKQDSDYAFRTGGDEFLFLSGNDHPSSFSEAVSKEYEERSGYTVTYSDGTFFIDGSSRLEDIIKTLDRGLIEKKRRKANNG